MQNIEKCKKEYNAKEISECPYCGQEDFEHVCGHCYSDITKKECWEYNGYCKKCYDHINVEVPKIETLKKKLGVKCQCNNPVCGKCLSVNCQDDNCPVHTMEAKLKFRKK